MLWKVIVLSMAPALVSAQAAVVSDSARPISVQEAVRLAQENNVSAITAENSIRSAQNQVRSARAQLYPSLNASASQTNSAGDRVGPGGTIIGYNSGWTYNTGLNSSVTLFDGGKTFADVKARQADVAAAEAGQTTTEFNLAVQVKTQYNLILAAEESEAAARAQLALAQQQLATSIAKVNAGAASVSDSLRNVVAVANAQVAILNAQQGARTASAALTRLVGTPYLVTAQAADTTDVTVASVDTAEIMQLALNGPVIRETEAQVNSASAALRSSRSAFWPSVRANFSYGGSGKAPYGFAADSIHQYPYNRSVGLSFSYPLFNNFQRENQISTSQIALENTQATLKDERLAAQQNIVTQLGALRNAEERIRVQQLNVTASEEDLRVNQQRYALGAGTMVDVLTSQSALIAARQQLIQARLDYRNARAQIEAIIGRDLQ